LLRRKPSPDFDSCQATGADTGARASGPVGATGRGFCPGQAATKSPSAATEWRYPKAPETTTTGLGKQSE
jgi:hypothetical protein